jgi:hypothetical protein
MRGILLLLAGAAVLALPAAAGARAGAGTPPSGYLVVRDGKTDRGVAGLPVATVVVRGFVIGRIAQEGAVEVYRLLGTAAPQAAGPDLTRAKVVYHARDGSLHPGTRFSGSSFRFRAVSGVWRVVVYGAGVSLYAGGEGKVVTLHGSTAYPTKDGTYSLDGGRFVSLPLGSFQWRFGTK